MSSPLTIDQLENMKTHDLADLLANIVMVLRRMPDVSCKALQPSLEVSPVEMEQTKKSTTKPKKVVPVEEEQGASSYLAHFSQQELRDKKVPELRKIAKELHVLVSAKANKDELISKILAKQEHSHSEQFAIQHL